MSGTYQKDGLDWQLLQLQQRIGEWFEGLFPQDTPEMQSPNWWVPPEWLFRAAFWLVAITTGLWVLWQLYRLLRPHLNTILFANQSMQVVASSPERMVPGAEWLQRSRQFAQQGNYAEACRCLFLAMVQQLDETGQLPNDKSRTDGEYLRAVQTFAQVPCYRELIRTHERLKFGDQPVSQEVYQRCDRAYGEIVQARQP
jgi:hypothetical protein